MFRSMTDVRRWIENRRHERIDGGSVGVSRDEFEMISSECKSWALWPAGKYATDCGEVMYDGFVFYCEE